MVSYHLFVWLGWVVACLWNKKLLAYSLFGCWSPSVSCASGTIIVWPCSPYPVSSFPIDSISTHQMFSFFVVLKDDSISKIYAYFSCVYDDFLILLVYIENIQKNIYMMQDIYKNKQYYIKQNFKKNWVKWPMKANCWN